MPCRSGLGPSQVLASEVGEQVVVFSLAGHGFDLKFAINPRQICFTL